MLTLWMDKISVVQCTTVEGHVVDKQSEQWNTSCNCELGEVHHSKLLIVICEVS